MLSSRRSVSNENEVATLQTPRKKSIGRTPLQSLPPQTVARFDTSCPALLAQPVISAELDNLKTLRSPAVSSEAHLLNRSKNFLEKREKCSKGAVIPVYVEESSTYCTQTDRTEVKTVSQNPLENHASPFHHTQLAFSETDARNCSVHETKGYHLPDLPFERQIEVVSILSQIDSPVKSTSSLTDVIRNPELTKLFTPAVDLKLHKIGPRTEDNPCNSDLKQYCCLSPETGVKQQEAFLDKDPCKYEEQRLMYCGDSLQPDNGYFAVGPLNVPEGDYSKHPLQVNKQNSVSQSSQSDGITGTDNFRSCFYGAGKKLSCESQLVETQVETLAKPDCSLCEATVESLQRNHLGEVKASSSEEINVMENEIVKSLPLIFENCGSDVINEAHHFQMKTCENSLTGKDVCQKKSSIFPPAAKKCTISSFDFNTHSDEAKSAGRETELDPKQSLQCTLFGLSGCQKANGCELNVASVEEHTSMAVKSPCNNEVIDKSVMQADPAESVIGPLAKLDISSQCIYSLKKNTTLKAKDAVVSSMKQDQLHGHTQVNADSQALAVMQVEIPESLVQCEDFHSSHLNCIPVHELEVSDKTIVIASDSNVQVHTLPVSATKSVCFRPEVLLENFVTTSSETGNETVVLPSVSFSNMQLNGSPVMSSNVATWVSPATLLERSTNITSLLVESVTNMERFATDSATETDSLLWNCSKKALSSLPREELEHHLESALIINEVLSQQVKELRNCCSTPYPGPSVFRDVVTQTDISLHSEAERRYQQLYLRSLERIHCLDHEHEMLRQLWESQHSTYEHLKTLAVKSDCCFEFVDGICTETRESNQTLHYQVSQMRSVLSKNQELLQKMKTKVQSCVEESEKMKAQMEAAYMSKKLIEQCLEEFRSHSATRINELTCTSETLREVLDLLKEACNNQCLNQKELVEASVYILKMCLDMEDDHAIMLQQMRKCKDLLSRKKLILQATSKKMQAVLLEQAEMRLKMEISVEENGKLQHQIEQATADLNFSMDQIQLLNQENKELEADIKFLQKTVSKMELERSQLQDEKNACCTELNSRDDSMKLMESRLAEEMSKLEQAQKENEILNLQVSDLEKQQDYLKNLLQQQDEQSYQISWQQNQCTAMAEKIEFLEYENQLHLEHLADMESKMKTNLYSLRERNVQCEELKKQASQLQRERDALQEELDCTKAEARFMLLKLGREMRNCSLELSKIKEKLQDLISSMQTNTQKDLCLEAKPLDTPAAKNRSFVASVLEAFTGQQMVEETEIANDTQEDHPSCLGSEKSAFTRVEPTTPKREPAYNLEYDIEKSCISLFPEAEQSLWTSVTDLDETVANLLVIVCQSQEKKEFEIQKLHHEMSLLQEEQQNIDIQHSSEVKSLQIQIEYLEHTNQKFNDMLEKNESLQEELEQLKHALGKAELDAKKLHEEQERSRDSNTVPEHSDLVQEAVGLKQEVNKLKKLLSECETSKSEILARACRHRKIQDENIRKTEEELQKLDSIIERVRETLMCIPNVVAGCKELQTLLEFIG